MPHFNNPLPRSGMPSFSESSTLRTIRDSASTGMVWKKAKVTTRQENANTKAIHNLQRRVELMKRRVSSTIPAKGLWATPPEYDRRIPYDIGTWVIVSPDNPNVANANCNTNADPGVYVCVQPTGYNIARNEAEIPVIPGQNTALITNGYWNDSVYWVPLAGVGGAGGQTQCLITSLSNASYFGVRAWHNSLYSGGEFAVAKSVPSRQTFGDSVDIVVINDNERTANGEYQVMVPPFNIGDLVFITNADHTDINIGNKEIKFIEVSTEREWCHPANTNTVSGVIVYTP